VSVQLLLNNLATSGGLATAGKPTNVGDISLQQTGSTSHEKEEQNVMDGEESDQNNPGKMFIGGLR
jgi:hypothetical protein